MELSIFLAKAIGLYCLIVGFALLVKGSKIKPLMNELIDISALSFVGGFIALILGILLITSHNIWIADWRVVITLVGWAAFMKGIFLVGFTEFTLKMSQKWLKCDMAYYLSSVFVLLVGVFLIYHGYF